MESGRQPPEAKPGTNAGGGSPGAVTGGSTGVAVRKYPKPPGLLVRMVLLCLKPESWAAAARYPSRFTMIPLALAVIIAGAVIGVTEGMRISGIVKAFAPTFPAMEISSEGVLKAGDKFSEPLRLSIEPWHFVIDPTNKTTLESVKKPGVVLITDREIVLPGLGDAEFKMPLALYAELLFPFPEKGKTGVIDSAAVRDAAPRVGGMFGLVLGTAQMVGDGLWALMMMFFLVPLITLSASIGERRLILPKRAAYRMAAALLVPLILFNAVTQGVGYSMANSIGREMGMLVWFFGAAGLAIWTGVMARGMYGPAKRGARGG